MLYRPAVSPQPLSSKDGASPWQIGITLAFLLLLTAAVATGLLGLVGLALLTAPLFLILIAVHLGALIDALTVKAGSAHRDVSAPSDWPVYSILIALRHESRMAEQLVDALDALDYPIDHLDVLFLIEADDIETMDAFRVAIGSRNWRVVIVPPGGPLTKPNALNFGLALARGALITVFDAEDLPEPQQLRLAAARFEVVSRRVMALQAHLEFDNDRDGWLPKMMAIEYAALFELTKPGLAAAGYPVALGGTSNHFRGIR
jgi:glycosyltransferase XagB